MPKLLKCDGKGSFRFSIYFFTNAISAIRAYTYISCSIHQNGRNTVKLLKRNLILPEPLLFHINNSNNKKNHKIMSREGIRDETMFLEQTSDNNDHSLMAYDV